MVTPHSPAARRTAGAAWFVHHGKVMVRMRGWAALVGAGLVLAGCGAAPVSGDAASDAASDAADGPDPDGAPERREGGYGGEDRGPCTPGVPRCDGDFGYQMCQQDGTFGAPSSCAGYSSNGTSSYCAEIPGDTGETWATCVDPACWYWLGRGALPGPTPVGICLPDGTLNRCSAGGTLAVVACAGVCTRVGLLDGRALGSCAAACRDGARECLGGPFYRTCAGGAWSSAVAACDGASCNPIAGARAPDIRCGGACDPGTSRCNGELTGVETCTAGVWATGQTCTLGRCRPAGPQAQCQAECAPGQRACAFDGAGAERRCDEGGRWTPEAVCAAGTSCRVSGDLALGCVACVEARAGGGNAYGAADGRCAGGAPQQCGADNQWRAPSACPAGQACVELRRDVSTLAACQPP